MRLYLFTAKNPMLPNSKHVCPRVVGVRLVRKQLNATAKKIFVFSRLEKKFFPGT
jgi:hypothetical protein